MRSFRLLIPALRDHGVLTAVVCGSRDDTASLRLRYFSSSAFSLRMSRWRSFTEEYLLPDLKASASSRNIWRSASGENPLTVRMPKGIPFVMTIWRRYMFMALLKSRPSSLRTFWTSFLTFASVRQVIIVIYTLYSICQYIVNTKC